MEVPRFSPLPQSQPSIGGLEDRARSCYSDNVGPQMDNEFVKMMLLDGCFLVELFLLLNEDKEDEDPIFTTMWMLPCIEIDTILLENQIPFFILQRIFEMATQKDEPACSLAELALDFLKRLLPRNKEIPIRDSYHHLLHLLQLHVIPTEGYSNLPVESIPNKWKNLRMFLSSKCFLPSSNNGKLPIRRNNQSPPLPDKKIPSAADLQLSGINFKKNNKWSSILDVKFSHGVLEIPPLSVNDDTDIIFRNLVAFEQFSPHSVIRFTTYLTFMDGLVNTSRDVALLQRNGIILNLLGSEEAVANLLNGLSYGMIDLENHYLLGLYQDLDKHYNTKWHMWWASLKRDYFTNPWSGLSSTAAAILILFTIAQTFYAIFSYYRPHPSS